MLTHNLKHVEEAMDVSNYKFSDHEIELLNQYRDNQDDARLQARFIALLMLAEGIQINKVASIIGKSIKTIENWHRQYVTKGIDSLNFFQYKPKQSYLNDEQIEQLTTWVKSTNPATLKQVRAYIIEQFKVKYTTEAIRKLLHKKGLKLLRPKVIPGNPPSEEEQKKKLQNTFK
jgi:transposase